MITYEYTLGQHWLSALINSDFSGLEDSEIKALDLFTESLPQHPPAYGIWDVIDESPDFARCEISGLHDSCCKVNLNYVGAADE
jgi:hypothetical protein